VGHLTARLAMNNLTLPDLTLDDTQLQYSFMDTHPQHGFAAMDTHLAGSSLGIDGLGSPLTARDNMDHHMGHPTSAAGDLTVRSRPSSFGGGVRGWDESLAELDDLEFDPAKVHSLAQSDSPLAACAARILPTHTLRLPSVCPRAQAH
jgi:hypothetical protein